MRDKLTSVLALSVLLAACSDSGTTGSGGTGGEASTSSTKSATATGTGTGSATSSSTGMACMVPNPGTQVGTDWADEEPNNDACHATPVGVLNGPVWAGFADPVTTINDNTDSDFFVFKTGDAASLANDYISLCWSGTENIADLYLYSVDASGMLGPEIKSATSTTGGCETIVDMGMGATTLMANTTYVLEVRAAPGLMLATPTDGLYSA